MKSYGNSTMVYTRETVPTILQWVEPNSRVLEFGPAYGYMTRYLKEVLHCQITCIELNISMKSTLEQYAEKIIIADIDLDSWEEQLDGKFDYIIFGDVLEHLRNPLLAMKKATLFGDCVLTSVPNIGHSSIILSLLSGEFSYQTYGLLDDTHIHFFTRHGIEDLMNTCSFECIDEKSLLVLYPFDTEFKMSYARHLLAAWSICRKPDSSVYQFVNKWKRISDKSLINKSVPVKQSCLKSNKIIILDSIKHYLTKYHLKNNLLEKIWQKIR